MNPTNRPDWQQRVIDEKGQLDQRIRKLSLALGGSTEFIDIDQALLQDQLTVMREYSDILGRRIGRFGGKG